jgi:protein-S-isoprenylcysteine O-methyltransferase Ste14
VIDADQPELRAGLDRLELAPQASPQAAQTVGREDALAAGGGWIFRNRSWLPVPLALLLLGSRWHAAHVPSLFPVGEGIVVLGLAIRFWAVRHIGTISRTRSGRLGPLMLEGPYLLVRNPLYVGNFLIWTGFAVASQLLWMLPLAWGLFALQYAAIVRFEEALLVRQFGTGYLAYARRVPAWLPRMENFHQAWQARGVHGWRAVLFSERGTLIAASVMTLLLLARYHWLF